MGSPNGWIGVDLDGTIATYDGWKSHDVIGEPIPEMVARVKQWLAQGREVRIFTARVSQCEPGVVRRIEDWCLQHIGEVLSITCQKDYMMIELWDDRAVQVISNTGRRADGKE